MGMRIWFLFLCTLLLTYYSAYVSPVAVTLNSIELFKTHQWIATPPNVFFQCKGEQEIVLPDVKATHHLYTFKGEESWQPLTELNDIKCKRCGLYQKVPIKVHITFDEWELCASDFTRSDGRYIHFKENEFNATFLCLKCVPPGKVSDNSFNLNEYINWILIPAACIIGAIIFIAGLVAIYKYCQKRKRQRQQARFLKLFEDNDDIDDELGIDPLNNTL